MNNVRYGNDLNSHIKVKQIIYGELRAKIMLFIFKYLIVEG